MRALILIGFATALSAQTTPENARWRLVELDGKPQASPPGTRQIYIRLSSEAHRFEGFAGCNTVSGGYQLDGAALKFGDVASTRMACPSLEIETRFDRALATTTAWRIDGGRLELRDPGGKLLARFESDDPWQKVIALDSGSEIRVTRKGGKPVAGLFASADAERVVVVIKNEQVAVAKEQIALLEARPKTASRVTRTSETTQNMPLDRPPAANPAERMRPSPPNSTSSSSSGVTFSKPGFEVVYRSR